MIFCIYFPKNGPFISISPQKNENRPPLLRILYTQRVINQMTTRGQGFDDKSSIVTTLSIQLPHTVNHDYIPSEHKE